MLKEIGAYVERISLDSDLARAFFEIQQPRTPFQLEKFVIGQHATPEMQYFQCVLELQVKYNNIRRAILNRRRTELSIEALMLENTPDSLLQAELKKIDIEELDGALYGAIRELDTLYTIWRSFPHRYTRSEIDSNQLDYWNMRLGRDAELDIAATGRIAKGTLEAISQFNGRPATAVSLDDLKAIEVAYHAENRQI